MARIYKHLQQSFHVVKTIKKQARKISSIHQALEQVKTLIVTLTNLLLQAADEKETS